MEVGGGGGGAKVSHHVSLVYSSHIISSCAITDSRGFTCLCVCVEGGQGGGGGGA